MNSSGVTNVTSLFHVFSYLCGCHLFILNLCTGDLGKRIHCRVARVAMNFLGERGARVRRASPSSAPVPLPCSRGPFSLRLYFLLLEEPRHLLHRLVVSAFALAAKATLATSCYPESRGPRLCSKGALRWLQERVGGLRRPEGALKGASGSWPSRPCRELSPAAASFCSEAAVLFFPSDSALARTGPGDGLGIDRFTSALWFQVGQPR